MRALTRLTEKRGGYLHFLKNFSLCVLEHSHEARIFFRFVLDKMVKQRRESISQYEKAGRAELVEQEEYEITVLQDFLPEQLSADEIEAIINEAIEQTGASSIKDMGKVMGIVKPKIQGRADMGAVSGQIKSRLA